MTSYFYIDESGHTGTNLFDANQPILYYGVLSAKVNLDVLAAPYVQRARAVHHSRRLHANELGMGGLVSIAHYLYQVQRKYQPVFDMYRVAKPDHAIISFFDQVFDQGVNPAMTWSGYWTPLRYVLLLKVASLFDDALAKKAWRARVDCNDQSAERELVAVCQELHARLVKLPDARSRQLLGDSLEWATKHPRELRYNCKSKSDVLSIAPNVIGFQMVLQGIARRLGDPKAKASITVDRQSQFNRPQRALAEFYVSVRSIPWTTGPGMPEMELANVPTAPLQFKAGDESVGLELVDVYLWLFKNLHEKSPIPAELVPLVRSHLRRGHSNDVSINSLAARWQRWFDNLPEPDIHQVLEGKRLLDIHEKRRLQGMRDT